MLLLFDIKFCLTTLIAFTILLAFHPSEAHNQQKSAWKGSNFCRGYPPISRLFRLHHRLYLELSEFPEKYILFYLHNGTFADNLVRLSELMGERNEHIFASIISASSLGHDFYAPSSKPQAPRVNPSSQAASNESESKNYLTPVNMHNEAHTSDDSSVEESDIEQVNQSSSNTSMEVNANSSFHSFTRPRYNSQVRIWGYMDTGAAIKQQPRIGYEDFVLNIEDGSLHYENPDKSDLKLRRTPFPFNCFLYLPGLGTVAIVERKYEQHILPHQASRTAENSKTAARFDVTLKVFYSESKYDSCVDFNGVVALLTSNDHITAKNTSNKLTIIDREKLALSFNHERLQVFSFIETNLYQLLCNKSLNNRGLLDLKLSLKRQEDFLSKLNLSTIVSGADNNGENLLESKEPTIQQGSSDQQKQQPQEQSNGISTAEGLVLNRLLFVFLVVICVLIAMSILVAFFMVLLSSEDSSDVNANAAAANGAAGKVNYEQLKQPN